MLVWADLELMTKMTETHIKWHLYCLAYVVSFNY